MSDVKCNLKLSPTALVFKQGDQELQEIKCALDGTRESKSIRLYNNFIRMCSFLSPCEKSHISFLIDGKKVLVRRSDLHSLNLIHPTLSLDTIEQEAPENRLSFLIDRLSTPQKARPLARAQKGQRRFGNRLTTYVNPSAFKSPQESRPVDSVETSEKAEDALPVDSVEASLEKVEDAFKRYGLKWPLEGEPETLEGRVSALVGHAIQEDDSLVTFIGNRLIGHLKGGRILVGETLPEALSSGGNGTIHAGEVTIFNAESGGAKRVFIALKKPKSHLETAEIQREQDATQAASEGDKAVIRLIAPVRDAEGMAQETRALLFPLFDGSFKSHVEKGLKSSFSYEERLKESVGVFKTLSESLSQKHVKEIIHNDIKMENILVKYKGNGSLKKVVLADWSNKMDSGLTVTSIVTFKEEYDLLKQILANKKKNRSLTPEEIRQWKDTRKKIDVRQLAFFMYEILGAYKKGADVTYPAPYLFQKDESGNEWPNLSLGYKDLPSHVPERLRNLIKDMLDSDSSKVPTMQEVVDRLNQMNI